MVDKTEEMRTAELCAVVLVNRFVAGMDTTLTRIVFLEAFPSGALEPRTALVMLTSDAVALYQMLGELIAKQSNLAKAH